MRNSGSGRTFRGTAAGVTGGNLKQLVSPGKECFQKDEDVIRVRGGPSCPSRKRPCYPAFLSRMTRALMDSLGPEWRLKLPSIPLVPVSAQKRWNSLPPENHKETAKSKSKETRNTKSKVPSAEDVERARVLKEEGNELVKKGNHKKAIEKYSESLSFSNLESATYSNRALCYLVLKQYKEAVKDCTEALKLDGKNVKAFYRRAQAYKALKDYKSSFADINSLLQIEPRNGPAQKLQQEVNQNLN